MMTGMIRLYSVVLFVTAASFSAASADEKIPQLTGTWKGTNSGGARYGVISHGKPLEVPTFTEPTQQWTLVIEKQEGRGLIGTYSGSTKVEKMLGAIRADNKTIVFSDEDTLHNAVLLDENKLELCGQEAKEDEIIAVCWLFERQ